jgi:hypothetical protein
MVRGALCKILKFTLAISFTKQQYCVYLRQNIDKINTKNKEGGDFPRLPYN